MNVVRFHDLSSNLMLWYPEPASVRDKYLTIFNFGEILLSMGPIWTGLISTWFSLVGSKDVAVEPFCQFIYA